MPLISQKYRKLWIHRYTISNALILFDRMSEQITNNIRVPQCTQIAFIRRLCDPTSTLEYIALSYDKIKMLVEKHQAFVAFYDSIRKDQDQCRIGIYQMYAVNLFTKPREPQEHITIIPGIRRNYY